MNQRVTLTTHGNASSGKQDNQKVKACISKETFVNVFFCYPVSPVQLRKSDTFIHKKPNNFGRFKNLTNHCCNCGELCHQTHSCPKKYFPANQSSTPSKMNKTDAGIKNKHFDLFDWFRSDQVLDENFLMETNIVLKATVVQTLVSIKGILKKHLDSWENLIGANAFVYICD